MIFLAFNPFLNSWTSVIPFTGGKRYDAVAFVINDKVYMGTGNACWYNTNDWWEFTPDISFFECYYTKKFIV